MAKKTNNLKEVYNRGGQRVELIVNGKVNVLLPGSTLEVPMDLIIPDGLGLVVR